jgi:mediator of RNA polymerase II transcription subunit 20
MIQKRLELLGAEKTGSFAVDNETYQSQPPVVSRIIHILRNSDQMASCFAVLDTGTCLVADSSFDLLMQNIKQFYAVRKNLRVESRGQRYQLDDIIVKVGSVVIGQSSSFRGVLVEVEYLPCVVAAECWPLMKEFIVGLLGPVINASLDVPSQHFRNTFDAIQSPSDVVLQYLEHFNNFRKVASQQSPR